MRKPRRSKKHSCAACKPYKMGWDYRFKPRERELRERTDKEIRTASSFSRAPGLHPGGAGSKASAVHGAAMVQPGCPHPLPA